MPSAKFVPKNAKKYRAFGKILVLPVFCGVRVVGPTCYMVT